MYQSKYRGDEIEQKLDQLDVTQPLSEVISDFEKEVASQESKRADLESKITEAVDIQEDSILNNSYIDWSGSISNYEYWTVALFKVKEGDTFEITSPYNFGATIAYQYAIYSSEEISKDTAMVVGNQINRPYSLRIVIPGGAAILAVQKRLANADIKIQKVETKFSVIEGKIEAANLDLQKLEQETQASVWGLGDFVFDDKPIPAASIISGKQLNHDGSLRDYAYDNISMYPVNEGAAYRIKGQTIGADIYLYAFYSSAEISAESLVKIGAYYTYPAMVKDFDYIEIAPANSKYLAVCAYKDPYNGITSPLAAYGGIYSAELNRRLLELVPMAADVDNLMSVVFVPAEKTVQGEYVSGKKLNGSGNITDDSLYGVFKYRVNADEEYRLFRNYDIGGTGSYTYALYTSEEPSASSVVKVGPAFDDPIDILVKIPDNVVLMVVGKVTSYETTVTKIEYVSRFETNAETVPNFAVEIISGDEVSVTRRYSESEDVRVTLKKCGANNLMAIYSHSFVNNTDSTPSFKAPAITKNSGTDWIGPYVIKANNRPGSYNGFTGGWHGYNGDQTGAKTAETIDVKILVDGREGEVGNHYCNDLKIVVTNHIQAGNTKAEDGNGVNVLKEVVTYHFKDSKIHVSVCVTALEDVSFDTYYGMQVTNYSQSIRYFADNILHKEWSASANKTDKKNLQFIVCKGADGRCVKAAMDIVGLGMREYSIPTSIAFVSGGKAYYSLVSADYGKTLTLMLGEQAYWRGYYEFLPTEFEDSCIM